MTELPDYYAILEVPRHADAATIRRAYQRKALECHPDRNQQSATATRQFQLLADAYYVLGDEERRRAYDTATRNHRPTRPSPMHSNADTVFEDAFEEMLRPEVANPGWFWWWLGGIAGFLMGLIIANFIGAITGAYIGSKIGHVRDVKGVPVAQVFQRMDHGERFRVLQRLATQMLS